MKESTRIGNVGKWEPIMAGIPHHTREMSNSDRENLSVLGSVCLD